jgi:hypothetical protein
LTAVLTRQDFLAYFGGLTGASAAVEALPQTLVNQGWWSASYAKDADIVLDTYNGVAAMLWPGRDAYSVAQGEWNDQPGAIAANAGRHVIVTLDGLVGCPPTPLSGLLASAINSVALDVRPPAVGGSFPSPFSRLPFAGKATVWRTLEQHSRQVSDRNPTHSLRVLQFVLGALPAFVREANGSGQPRRRGRGPAQRKPTSVE